MKKLIYLFISILMMSSFCFAAPVIDVDNKNPVYKGILEGDTVYHTYIVKNKGNETLKIEGVKAGG